MGGAAQDDPRWGVADPICTFLFAVLVLLTTRAILRDISDVLMERVPRAHDSAAVETALLQVLPVNRSMARSEAVEALQRVLPVNLYFGSI